MLKNRAEEDLHATVTPVPLKGRGFERPGGSTSAGLAQCRRTSLAQPELCSGTQSCACDCSVCVRVAEGFRAHC